MSIDLGSVPEPLFESELFGYEKGAFTDARKAKAGRMETASGGTLFLDEIGNLPLPLQAKLLAALERREISRLGSTQVTPIDVRLVCATNADIHTAVSEGRFREDLFYRINIIHLHLPPLRERQEDIPLLVEHFIRQTCVTNGLPIATASPEAIQYLQTLPFPGNIRELKNLVERTILMSPPAPKGGERVLGIEDFKTVYMPSEQSTSREPSPLGGRGATLEEIERASIAAAIEKHQGNLSLVAKELGISRGALYRKIEKHGL